MNTLAFNIDYHGLAETIARELLYSPPGYGLVKALQPAWPEDQVSPAAPSSVQPSEVKAGGVVAGRSSHPIRHAIEHAAVLAEANGDNQRRIPDGDTPDALLMGARGRWRMPEPWRRRDFERIFQRSLEDVLGEIKANTYPTYSALAKTYGRKPSWVSRSLRYCLLREKLISQDEVAHFDEWFPVSNNIKKGMNRR